MLDRQHRFRGLGSVRPVMQRGLTVRDGLFTLKVLLATASPRAAIVVSRRTAASAVVRNRIRRRFYARLAELWPHLPRPVDLVIIVHDAAILDLDSPELAGRLERALHNALNRLNNR